MEVGAPAVASQHAARRRARVFPEWFAVGIESTFHFEVAAANP
jgi:hypothetical protein